MRWLAVMAAVVAEALVLGVADAQRPPGGSTPPALRQFDGALYGEVVSVGANPRFTGLVLRIALVEPTPGSAAVDLAQVANSRVSIRVATGANGRPASPELADALRRLQAGQAVRVDARATGAERALYARQIRLAGGGPLPARISTWAAVDGTSQGPSVERMNQELHSLRRDLARLQQDVAELRALTQELSGRLPRP